MDYTSFSPEALAMDASFQNWVKHQDQADILFWEDWTKAHPEKADTVSTASALVALLQMPKQSLPTASVEEEIRQVRRRMTEETLLAPNRPAVSKPHPARLFRSWRVAAVFTPLAVAAVLLYFLVWRSSNQLEYATAYGEVKEVTLPDGSVVTLSANSHLRISPDWTDYLQNNSGEERPGNREVWLEGMAYFKVTHLNRSQPHALPVKFIVHAGEVNVEVVGTEFNVLNRPEKVQVVLNSGKVQLRIQDRQPKPLAMQPGELFELSKQSNQVRQKKVNARQYTEWQEGELRLDHTPMSKIAKIIEEAYGYPVVIEPESLKERHVTGIIQNRDLNFLLQTLSAVLSIEAVKENGKVVLRDTLPTE